MTYLFGSEHVLLLLYGLTGVKKQSCGGPVRPWFTGQSLSTLHQVVKRHVSYQASVTMVCQLFLPVLLPLTSILLRSNLERSATQTSLRNSALHRWRTELRNTNDRF